MPDAVLYLTPAATDEEILGAFRAGIRLEAPAALRPCSMYRDHGSAVPSVTQGHHARPVYLQKRLWGEVRDHTLVWLCGTCHDNLHAWLYALMGERRAPDPAPPARARSGAVAVVDWYHAQEEAA